MGNTTAVKIITFLGAVLFGAMFFALPADAITLNPPIFEFHADPGDFIEDSISIFNDSAENRLYLTPHLANFTYKEGDETTGTPVYYDGDEVKTGYELAPWVALEAEAIEVAPLARRTFPFTISIPDDAGPGSYFGGVIFRLGPQDSQVGVGLSAGTAVMMILRVSGDANESAVLMDFSTDKGFYSHPAVRVMTRVMNDGNTHLQPYGTVRITDVFGREAGLVEINPELRGVLPGSARRFAGQWGDVADEDASELSKQWNNFKFGKFTATLDMKYGTVGKTFMAQQSFWVLPWLVILVLVGGLLALILVIRKMFKWYERQVIERYRTREDR